MYMVNTCILGCSFEPLVKVGEVANDEGIHLTDAKGVSLQQCKEICSRYNACKSFAYCSENQGTCYQKGGIFTGTEPTFTLKNNNGRTCTTYYHACGKDNNYKINSCTTLIKTIHNWRNIHL